MGNLSQENENQNDNEYENQNDNEYENENEEEVRFIVIKVRFLRKPIFTLRHFRRNFHQKNTFVKCVILM